MRMDTIKNIKKWQPKDKQNKTSEERTYKPSFME